MRVKTRHGHSLSFESPTAQPLDHLAAALNDLWQHCREMHQETPFHVGARAMSHRHYDICPETTPAAAARRVLVPPVNPLELPAPTSAVVLDRDSYHHHFRPQLHRPCTEQEDHMAPT